MFCFNGTHVVPPERVKEWLNPGLLAFAVAGLVHPVLSRYCAYEANRRVGATISGTLDATAPLFAAFAAALAILFLGEGVTTGVIIGTVFAVGGVMFIYWTPVAPAVVMQVAVLFSFGTAMFRAFGMVAGKFGLNVLPNPFWAAFVTFAMSALIAVSVLTIQRKTVVTHLRTAGTWWFVASGVVSACASVCLYFALLYGDAIIVIPIVSAAPLFTMFIGMVFGLEKLEKLTGHVMIGMLVTVAGVALVALSSF